MSDPTIRAALEAAANALRGALTDDACGASSERNGYIDVASADDEAVAAAAVAAFLRALPDRFSMPGEHNHACQVWGHAKGEMRRLAAAVEALTKEVDHET
jgi:hypothetical protein